MKKWGDLISDAEDLGEVDVLSIIHSPKSIGNCQNQIVWYTKGSSQYNLRWIKRQDGNWSALFLELRDWLNTYVAPHQLLAVSIFEEAHPNTQKGINAVIVHTAGKDPIPLLSKVKNLPARGLYILQVVTGSLNWPKRLNEAKERMNKLPGYDAHVMSSTNDSTEQAAIVITLSWMRDWED